MIKSIELKNIQSHENTRLELDKGINCVVGSSNNGKSAILRGLYWLKYNRPLGIDTLASHWALNDKGDLKAAMSVTIKNESGEVTRKRTKTENQYIVNGEVLNVVKSDVPDGVEKALRLTDTNIQRQLDEPFLLSSTSGEVAKYFNKVVRLDIIDKVLTNAESTRRKTRNDIENAESQIKDLQDKLDGFDWLETAERLLDKYERVAKNNEELREKASALKESVSKYEELSEFLSDNDFSGVEKIIQKIEKSLQEKQLLAEKIYNLSNDVSYVENTKIYDFGEESGIVEELLAYKPDRNAVEKLRDSLESLARQRMNIENCEKEISLLKKELPDVCPLCGKPMELCNQRITMPKLEIMG